MRKPVIAGNWKMNLLFDEAQSLLRGIMDANMEGKDVFIFAPSIYLQSLVKIVANSGIRIGAQNLFVSEEGKMFGAFTGEHSPEMLKSIGVTISLLGHSERRNIFGESSTFVGNKVKYAVKSDFDIMLCVGEKLFERENGKTFEVVKKQLEDGLFGVSADEFKKHLFIAYEPVWAIGTGKTATPAQAQEVHEFIRSTIEKMYDNEAAQNVRLLYGGSVKPSNIDELMAMPDIDGVLVGGASLKVESFKRIIEFKEV